MRNLKQQVLRMHTNELERNLTFSIGKFIVDIRRSGIYCRVILKCVNFVYESCCSWKNLERYFATFTTKHGLLFDCFVPNCSTTVYWSIFGLSGTNLVKRNGRENRGIAEIERSKEKIKGIYFPYGLTDKTEKDRVRKQQVSKM